MHRFINFNIPLSCVLSTGLIFGPCYSRPIEPFCRESFSIEELGLESLGLDKEYKKLTGPIKELDAKSGRVKMANAATQFIAGLNTLTGCKLTIDDGIYQSALCLQHNGITIQQSKFAAFRKLLNKSQKSLSVEDNDEFSVDLKKSKNKEFGNVDDMSDTEILAYVYIFCGCLMMIVPNGICQGVGGGLTVAGVQQLMNETCVSDNKRNHR